MRPAALGTAAGQHDSVAVLFDLGVEHAGDGAAEAGGIVGGEQARHRLARQGQVQIVASARNLEGVMTPAVKGRMDVRTALRRLIAGTPLRIDSDDGQIITLRSSVQGLSLIHI